MPEGDTVDLAGGTVEYLGPDILGSDWDAELTLRNLLADPDRPIDLVLLDQRVIAGLGNVYRNELCFLHGVLPTRSVGEVADPGDVTDPGGLIDLAHRVILSNRGRAERSTTGDLRPGRSTWVNRREGKPCLRCGIPIRRGSLGESELAERDTYFCPVCQS